LGLACVKKFKEEGNPQAADLVKGPCKNPEELTESIERGNKFKNVRNYSPDEALALKLNLGLSRNKYDTMRMGMVAHGLPKMYPPKKVIEEAEGRCMPDPTAITNREGLSEVSLQELLDHTANRLVHMVEDKIASLREGNEPFKDLQITLISKWGFDGSSGHATFKQKVSEISSDASVVLTSLVPLELSLSSGGSKHILWLNIAPSSTRFCRPISFEYTQETNEFILKQHSRIESAITDLQSTGVQTSLKDSVHISHEMVASMFDGKICSALSGIDANSRCHVCAARPVEMNKLEAVKKRKVNGETFQFGLSPLHARIRCLEFVLNLSYKLDIKKWRVGCDKDKESVQLRKKAIQDSYRSETGLLVDCVKQGFGSTNDGNTARRFFDDPKTALRITGVDFRLIERLSLILNVLSCGAPLNIGVFRKFCWTTAKTYVRLYPWFYMPQAVHKILIHGADIIEAAPLSCGQLSEEAQESRNKEVRKYRELYTRKLNRVTTNSDLMKKLLITSDPLISSLRTPQTRPTTISNEMKRLLILPEDSY
ncbi:hypothetical protein FOCC_FOCC013211, partial [Frankliniella occidentalis]